MDYQNTPAHTGATTEYDTNHYDSLTTTHAEREYSTVSYDKKDEIVDSKQVDITLKSKYNGKAQSNIEAIGDTASRINQTSITNVSKLSLIVVIVATVIFMVVIAITSSAVTAIILRKEIAKDLKDSVWSTWSDWGKCSVTCNVGVRTRHRTCDRPGAGGPAGFCSGTNIDISTCNNDFCAENLYKLLQKNKLGGSSTYVRWGRTTCPGNGTELVYRGYAGGSWYGHSGSAVNYICLPTDPDWGYFEDANQSGGLVYGAEYEFNFRTSPTKYFTSQQAELEEKDVPCAVCRSTRSSILMVPAKNQCHPGWTHEYHGYLSSNRYDHPAASEFVCVDDNAELLNGGRTTDYDGKLFYFVESRCGSLQCPPYVDGRELTCVVCTK